MSNNYSYNNNCTLRTTECAYSYNNNNSHHDISNSQVFINDQIGSCNSENTHNAKTSILVRILVVDDEPDINFIVKTILEKQRGFRVDSLHDPELALKSFRPGLYDLLILDIRMPKMNGIDLYNKISKMDENIRVCFLSANEQFYEDIKNQLSLSMEADFYFLQKPFSSEELVRHVDKIIA
jgi:two-component system, OmpR family, response regulator ChvI